MSGPDRAILLLAGRGRRLGSLTEDRPKCLLDVAGTSILERALSALSEAAVGEVILVVGYKADQIRGLVGERYRGLHMTYVCNEQYATTNTAYSLWLARRYLDAACMLIEGDILFDVDVLHRVMRGHDQRSAWAAIPISTGGAEGVLLERSPDGYVARLELVRRPEERLPSLRFKCAGIQVLTQSLAQSLAMALDQAVRDGRRDVFADLVLGEVLGQTTMSLCVLNGLRWGEVDDANDLRRVRELFPPLEGGVNLPNEKALAKLGHVSKGNATL